MRRTAISLLLSFAIVLGLGLGARALLAPPQNTLSATVSDADGLAVGNDVTVAGVAVGSVTAIKLGTVPADGGAPPAVVSFSITNPSYWPLHQGTRATITPAGVLSDVYLELAPGGTGAPVLAGGANLPLADTSSPVTLNQVTNILNSQVTASIDTQIDQGAVALDNGGAAGLSGTLTNLPTLLQQLTPVTDTLATDSPQLSQLNAEADEVTAQLANEDAQLAPLISNADTVMTAIAAREGALTGTLDNAAGTLTELDQSLSGDQAALQDFFREGPQALQLTRADAAELLPLIEAINPHVSDLNQLLTELRSATGYKAGGIDTLRVDGSLPPTTDHADACGGDPSQQSCGGGS